METNVVDAVPNKLQIHISAAWPHHRHSEMVGKQFSTVPCWLNRNSNLVTTCGHWTKAPLSQDRKYTNYSGARHTREGWYRGMWYSKPVGSGKNQTRDAFLKKNVTRRACPPCTTIFHETLLTMCCPPQSPNVLQINCPTRCLLPRRSSRGRQCSGTKKNPRASSP